MYQNTYDLVALGMRYFFLVLILYILIRLVMHSFTEFTAVQQIKKQVRGVSPGYLEVLAPEEYKGKTYPLRRENTIGRGKRCDICIPHESLALLHAFLYEKKGELYIAGHSGRTGVLLNGNNIRRKEELLYTRDELELGEVKLLLRLEGEEVPDES